MKKFRSIPGGGKAPIPPTPAEEVERISKEQFRMIRDHLAKQEINKRVDARVREMCLEANLPEPTEAERLEVLVQTKLDHMKKQAMEEAADRIARERFARA